MISLLCPTRQRREQFQRMCESAKATAGCEIEILSVSNDHRDTYTVFNLPDDIPTVYMWNYLADKAKGKLLMLCADDVIFSTPGWGRALLDHYESLENKIHVYHLLDSRGDNGTPHPIVTSEWYDTLGYFLPPLFLHWYVDTWTVEIARYNNCFTHMKDYLLIHDKPSDFGNPDNTYQHIRRIGWWQRDKEVNDRCQHFLTCEKMRLSKTMQNKHLEKHLRAIGA